MSQPLAEMPEEGSEADRLEQQMPATIDLEDLDQPDDVADVAEPQGVADAEGSEGDLIEQSQPVPLDDEEDRG